MPRFVRRLEAEPPVQTPHLSPRHLGDILPGVRPHDLAHRAARTSFSFQGFWPRDAVEAAGPSDPPTESPHTFSPRGQTPHLLQAPGRISPWCFSLMVLLSVSQQLVDLSMILAQGCAAFIQTPRLALLQIPTGLPHASSPSSCIHSLAAFSSSLQPTCLTVDWFKFSVTQLCFDCQHFVIRVLARLRSLS